MGFKFKGHIKVMSDDRVLFDGENTITTLFEELVMSGSVDSLFCNASAIEAGQNFIESKAGFFSGSYFGYINNQYLLTVYLLNLSEAEKNALSSDSHILPVFDGTYNIDNTKLVGYATATFTPAAAKEGKLTNISGINVINPKRHTQAWKWDAGVLNGSYNCIAIGANVITDRFAGFKINRGLDINNVVLGDTAASGYFLRPGVKTADNSIIYTTDSEILLGNASSLTNARRVLNLQTGEETILETTDPRYNFPLCLATECQLINGNNLIYNRNNTLYRRDLTTKVETSIVSSTYGGFIHNGYLYGVYNTTDIRAYNLSTFAYTSSQNLNLSSINLPAEFNTVGSNGLKISNVGSDFIISIGNTTITNLDNTKQSIICSDITNISGSIIDVIPQMACANGYIIANKKMFFMGICPSIYTLSGQYTYKDSSGSTKTIAKTGTKYTTAGMYGNLLSFKVFEESQTVSASEGLTVEYYYSTEN